MAIIFLKENNKCNQAIKRIMRNWISRQSNIRQYFFRNRVLFKLKYKIFIKSHINND